MNWKKLLCLGLVLTGVGACKDDKYEKMVVIGDSLAEGYQTGTCFYLTQTASYPARMAYKVMDEADEGFELPLLTLPISVDPIGGRRRMDPTLKTLNLGVGGAAVADIIAARATATSNATLKNEYDRVLLPRTGSQVDAAIAENPDLIVLWIGSNDALQSATGCDTSGPIPICQLDGVHGLTPVADFQRDYTAAVAKLKATGADIVTATIPSVSSIAYLVKAERLGIQLPIKLPLPIVFALKRDPVAGAALLANPNNYIDPIEEATIVAHIKALNKVITDVAAANNIPVVDTYGYFENIVKNQPITIPGTNYKLSADYAPALSATGTSGGFSLDGVHPSDTSYALVANEFIKVINSKYGQDFELIDVASIAQFDPYLDKDGDYCLAGPGFVSIPGVTGDSNDYDNTKYQCRAPSRGVAQSWGDWPSFMSGNPLQPRQ